MAMFIVELEPLVEALLVDQPRFADDEGAKLRVGGDSGRACLRSWVR